GRGGADVVCVRLRAGDQASPPAEVPRDRGLDCSLRVQEYSARINMYVPEQFKVRDEGEIQAFMEKYDFATVVSSPPTGLIATHVPAVIRHSCARGLADSSRSGL